MRNIRTLAAVLILLCADTIALTGAMTVAYGIRLLLNSLPVTPNFAQPLTTYLQLYWVPLTGLGFLLVERLYDRRLVFWEETGRVVKACLLAGAVTFAILTLSKSGAQYSRLLFVLYVLITLIFLPVFRLLTKRLLFHFGIWRRWALIVGTGEIAQDAALGLDRETHLGYRVAGFVSNAAEPNENDRFLQVNGSRYEVFPDFSRAEQKMPEGRVDLVVLAGSEDTTDLMGLVRDLHVRFGAVMIAPDVSGLPLLNTHPVRLFREQRLLLDIRNNLSNPLNRILKRTLDMVIVSLFAPVWLPIVGLFAVLVKLTSRGPVMFVQKRLGRDGGTFQMLKFRTMYVDADSILSEHLAAEPERKEEWERFRKLRGRDPRVTRLGRIMRKASLDELPQLIHVLTGQMSLVGPRPYMPEELDRLSDSASTILAARPGLTGLWQTSGRNRLTFRDRVGLDRWYVMNWTLWLDVEILVKTIRSVFRSEGAY